MAMRESSSTTYVYNVSKRKRETQIASACDTDSGLCLWHTALGQQVNCDWGVSVRRAKYASMRQTGTSKTKDKANGAGRGQDKRAAVGPARPNAKEEGPVQ